MALNEFEEEILTLTSSVTTGIISMTGPLEISIQGTFSGGTVTHYTSNSLGRGAAVRTATTVIDAYGTTVKTSEFEVTGADGSTDIDIIARKIPTSTRDA